MEREPGSFRGPQSDGEDRRHEARQPQGQSGRDRRRFRRQDGGLRRAGCDGPLEEGGRAGQARHVARGGFPRDRTYLRVVDVG